MQDFAENRDLQKEVETVLLNWGRWCRGGWPALDYSQPPTSRDYLPTNSSDKRLPPLPFDAVKGEAANLAIVNLALKGDTRSYQIIAAWWAHRRPAKLIAKQLHCSMRSVYNYRIIAMAKFWSEYTEIRAVYRKHRVKAVT